MTTSLPFTIPNIARPERKRRDDATVVAYAVAFSETYAASRQLFTERARAGSKPFSRYTLTDLLAEDGYREINPNQSSARFERKVNGGRHERRAIFSPEYMPTGIVVAELKAHWVTLIDRAIYDFGSHAGAGQTTMQAYWTKSEEETPAMYWRRRDAHYRDVERPPSHAIGFTKFRKAVEDMHEGGRLDRMDYEDFLDELESSRMPQGLRPFVEGLGYSLWFTHTKYGRRSMWLADRP